MSYRAPTKDLLFVMKELAGLDAVSRLPGSRRGTRRWRPAILAECSKLCEEVR